MGYCKHLYVNWLPAVECKQKMLNPSKKLTSQEKQTDQQQPNQPTKETKSPREKQKKGL